MGNVVIIISHLNVFPTMLFPVRFLENYSGAFDCCEH